MQHHLFVVFLERTNIAVSTNVPKLFAFPIYIYTIFMLHMPVTTLKKHTMLLVCVSVC